MVFSSLAPVKAYLILLESGLPFLSDLGGFTLFFYFPFGETAISVGRVIYILTVAVEFLGLSTSLISELLFPSLLLDLIALDRTFSLCFLKREFLDGFLVLLAPSISWPIILAFVSPLRIRALLLVFTIFFLLLEDSLPVIVKLAAVVSSLEVLNKFSLVLVFREEKSSSLSFRRLMFVIGQSCNINYITLTCDLPSQNLRQSVCITLSEVIIFEHFFCLPGFMQMKQAAVSDTSLGLRG